MSNASYLFLSIKASEEIRLVLFSLKDKKALSPDGFNAHSFKKAIWSTYGGDWAYVLKTKPLSMRTFVTIIN